MRRNLSNDHPTPLKRALVDTSCILAWLIEEGYEVYAFMADVGQEEVRLCRLFVCSNSSQRRLASRTSRQHKRKPSP